ncbi:hypothetical protein HPB49_004194 [Dermacentor silvarum]|uniref:Uncharacterized protein n=1 Tax=Dermacentor silvarum TaxID=543639 RepID=A0ACB8CPT0_DERSI|nr:hypothetical protein HPB49_004194 [Dermacentor silvarum]
MPSKPDSEGWTLVNRRKKAPFNKPTATTSFTSRLHGHNVILRPQGRFDLTTLRPSQLMSASPQKLAQLTTLTIQATSHQVSIYLASPDNSCRGAVHGIEEHTTSAELMANLDAPGFTIFIFAAPSAPSLCRCAMPLTHVPRTVSTTTALTLLQIQLVRVYRQQTNPLTRLPDSGIQHSAAPFAKPLQERDSSRRRSKSRTKKSHKSRSKSRPPPSSANPPRTTGPRLLSETTVPPPRTATLHLERLGVTNTLEELIEAHQAAQLTLLEFYTSGTESSYSRYLLFPAISTLLAILPAGTIGHVSCGANIPWAAALFVCSSLTPAQRMNAGVSRLSVGDNYRRILSRRPFSIRTSTPPVVQLNAHTAVTAPPYCIWSGFAKTFPTSIPFQTPASPPGRSG